jgi:uncharacterized membrane protein
MATSNGFNTSRIENLTDGVYSIAMTILVLGIKVPTGLESSQATRIFSTKVFVPLMIYFLSFLIIGTYWVGTHIQHHFTAKTDRILLWLNILLLMIIAVIPFSASFLNNYTDDKNSIIFYSINLLSASLCHLIMLYYSRKKKFLKPYVTRAMFNSVRTRILLPTIFYILAITVALVKPEYAVYIFFFPLVFDLIPGQVDKEIEQ